MSICGALVSLAPTQSIAAQCDYEIRNGRFSEGRVTFEYVEPTGTAVDTVTVTRKSANSISYVGRGSGTTFTGVLNKK